MKKIIPYILIFFAFSYCSETDVYLNSSQEKIETKNIDPSIPIAIIKYAEQTNPDEIKPLIRVFLDGQAKGNIETTHDPYNPESIELITDYTWEITSIPEGTTETSLQTHNTNDGLYSFIPSVVGVYKVELFVTNTKNLISERTSLEVIVYPDEQVRIELLWDQSNDIDLHLIHIQTNQNICNEDDMYFVTQSNPPMWFPQQASANPHLDVDNIAGYGPENINIDEPLDGTYRVYAYYYSGFAPTNITVKIYINSALNPFTYTRSVLNTEIWAVADIIWSNNSANVLEYPSDTPGEIGAVAQKPSPCSNWSFPN